MMISAAVVVRIMLTRYSHVLVTIGEIACIEGGRSMGAHAQGRAAPSVFAIVRNVLSNSFFSKASSSVLFANGDE